ncbi:unnamed protein product [Rotaria sordida]|uniref:Uncharacterized protein n=1 Tax=Rotaria sordida TaxID=392033 RepID=A0A815B644_9BILA|nr:unnamed protein product [Rotaria sordida]
MSQLKKFSFNIRSTIYLNNQINFQSNDDIQNAFKDFKDNQIISCVDYFPKIKQVECHIYSYPYRLKDYQRITNNFRDRFFQYIREISLLDEPSFEHEFFLRIAQLFPNMKILTLFND